MDRPKSKLLLIGWDAADWKIINRLIDKGEMPALKSMVEGGVMGNISTLEPAYSPMLWTTIATGKYPDKHGILGFSEPTPDHSSIRPVSNSSRKVKAIWNILTQNGYKTHVINWWPSHPAEPVDGIYVSNLFHKVNSWDYKNWEIIPDCVHPAELQGLLAHFRVHPLELSVQHIQPFIPEYEFNTLKSDPKIQAISKNLSEAVSVHAAATLALENEQWDFAAVYWETIDHFCHGFMNYTAPQMKGIKDADFKNYQHVVDGGYRLMDLMLSRLLQIAGDDCNVILLSDHGFNSGSLRKKHTPYEPAGPAHHHRDIGIFCARGPIIKKDELVFGASLLDITPTILTLLGLPVGEDMDGKPLVEIFKEKTPITTIPSWEEVPGECGMLPDEKRDIDPELSANAIQQLIELGYIEDPGPDAKKAVEKTVDELEYNLAQVYYYSERKNLALPLLEKLFHKNPYRGRYTFKLINCYLEEGEFQNAEECIPIFKRSAQNKILSKKEIEVIKNRRVPEILKGLEKKRWIAENKTTPVKESNQAKADLIQIKIVEGDILLKRGFPHKAIQQYRKLEKNSKKSSGYYSQMGRAFLKTSQWRDAEEMFVKLIDIYPENFNAHLGVGICNYHLERYEKALDHLLTSIGINFYNYAAHFNIGRTLMKIGDFENGTNAMEIALRINPNFGLCRNTLIEIYENQLLKPERVELLKQKTESTDILDGQHEVDKELIIRPIANAGSSEPIIVVSGLPRSGTSVMMQILEAAGVTLYSDSKRQADESNPKGYYEHEKVKLLIQNNRWMDEAKGKAVKIVVPLLYKVPKNFNYKVIYMLRDIDEIVESQHKMLVGSGKRKGEDFDYSIKIAYEKYLSKKDKWIEENQNADVLFLRFRDTIMNTKLVLEKIKDFLNISFDINEVALVIEQHLYRTKNL